MDSTVNESDIKTETAKYFYRTAERSKKIFKSPHILIKENISLSIAFIDEDLIFKHRIMGIYAPSKKELIELRDRIISKRELYRVFLLSRSAMAGISRSDKVVSKDDIMSLPYPDNFNKLRLSNAENIICKDILNYYKEQLAEGESARINTENANERMLSDFAKVFCTSLNSIYEEGSKKFYPLEHIKSLSFICQPFVYGNPERPVVIAKTSKREIERGNLESLLGHQQGKSVLYKRIIKLYSKDMVYLIKPKTLRYWLRSMALRDANEVFTDLVSSGY